MDEFCKIAQQLRSSGSEQIKQNLIHHLNECRWRALKFFITFEKTAEPVSSIDSLKADRCVEGRINIGRKSGVEIWAPLNAQQRPAMPVAIRLPLVDTVSDEQIPQREMGFHERLFYLNYSNISCSRWETCDDSHWEFNFLYFSMLFFRVINDVWDTVYAGLDSAKKIGSISGGSKHGKHKNTNNLIFAQVHE